MDEFLKYFTEDGTMRLKVETYFTSCDAVRTDTLDIIKYMLDTSMPIEFDSDAVALIYADMYETDGYPAYSLFMRHKY